METKRVAGGAGMKKEEMRERPQRPPFSELTPCEFEFLMGTLTNTAKELLNILQLRETTFSNIKSIVETLKEQSYLEPHEFDAYISKWTSMLPKMRTLYEDGLAIGKAWDDLSTREPPTGHSIIELKIHHNMSIVYKIPGQQEEIENCLRLTEAYLKERSEIGKRAFEFDKQESQMSKDIESDKDLCPHQLKERMDEVVEQIKAMKYIESDKDLRAHPPKEMMDEVVELIKWMKDNGIDPLQMLQVMEMVARDNGIDPLRMLQAMEMVTRSATPPSTTPMVSSYVPIFANATPDVFEKNMDVLTKLAKYENAAIKERVKSIAAVKTLVGGLKRKGIFEPHEFDAYFVKMKALFEVSKSLNEEGAALGKAWDELNKRKPPAHRNPVERSAIEKRVIEYEKQLYQLENDMKSDPDSKATMTKRIEEVVEILKNLTKSR